MAWRAATWAKAGGDAGDWGAGLGKRGPAEGKQASSGTNDRRQWATGGDSSGGQAGAGQNEKLGWGRAVGVGVGVDVGTETGTGGRGRSLAAVRRACRANCKLRGLGWDARAPAPAPSAQRTFQHLRAKTPASDAPCTVILVLLAYRPTGTTKKYDRESTQK